MKDKVALISGASRGIGAAIARRLLQDGYTVVAFSRGPLKESGESEFIELINSEPKLTYLTGNVAIAEDRQYIVEETMKIAGRIDVLVNNAGVAPRVRTDILSVSEESWNEVMDINLNGAMFLTQAVSNIMIAQERTEGVNGIIVNTGSSSAWASSPNRAEYCVSKAGVSMLTTLYADRLAEYGILVYEIRPGVIATKMTAVVKEKYDGLIARGDFPIARWGQPEDIALAVSSLCEGKLRYSTGEIINVDGGFHIRRL